RHLKRVSARQLPFAHSLIANRLAQQVKKNELDVVRARFDRPTRWTLNSLQLKPGNKNKPQARVWFRSFAPKGTAPDKYLQPQAFGGARGPKRMEKAMLAMGYLKPGQ